MLGHAGSATSGATRSEGRHAKQTSGAATTVSRRSQLTALEIARQATLVPITSVARDIGIAEDLLQPYGEFVAKLKLDAVEALADRPRARYVVVTAVTPTPLGEGKTTTTLGLAQGMRHIGQRATAAIRQSSMGPTFGIKGGAAGGGYSQAAPFEALNLHLTGDMHAVTAAHNTLSAMVDNHLYQGNELDLDPSSHHLAPGAGRQRPGPPQHRGGAGHPGGRRAPSGGLRHHRGQRGHGHPGPVHVPAGHAPPPGPDRGRASPPTAPR